MWPYFVPRLRDYYSREGRFVIGNWGTDCSRPAFLAPTRVGVETHPAFAGHVTAVAGRAHTRLRVDAEREGRLVIGD
jgi:hypothetical protein